MLTGRSKTASARAERHSCPGKIEKSVPQVPVCAILLSPRVTDSREDRPFDSGRTFKNTIKECHGV